LAVAEDASPGLGNGLDNTAENDEGGDDFELFDDEFELVFDPCCPWPTDFELPNVKFLEVKEGTIGDLRGV